MTYHPKSDFMRVMLERGFVADCTDYQALDEAFVKGVVPSYIGFDATAKSLHVGSLIQIMMLRWLQKCGGKPIVLMGGGFFEGGNVWAELRDLHLRGFRLTSEPGLPTDSGSTKDWDFRYSLGTGLRFDTPFGPVRIDVGFPLKRARYLSDYLRFRVRGLPHWAAYRRIGFECEAEWGRREAA